MPTRQRKKKQQVHDARKFIVDCLCDDRNEYAHELKLSLRHSLELIHHIQSEQGALRWKNRIKQLKNNPELVHAHD